MIWLQGWTVTTRGKGNSQCAVALICHTKLFSFWKWRTSLHRRARVTLCTSTESIASRRRGARVRILSVSGFFSRLPLNCGSLGSGGGTEALFGSLIGKHSALWPQWCRVTGQTRRGDWLAASAVECATSGVPEWKRAAWNKTLRFFLSPLYFSSFYFPLFTVFQLFASHLFLEAVGNSLFQIKTQKSALQDGQN